MENKSFKGITDSLLYTYISDYLFDYHSAKQTAFTHMMRLSATSGAHSRDNKRLLQQTYCVGDGSVQFQIFSHPHLSWL